MKNYQQTPKQRQIQRKKLEISKRQVKASQDKHQQQHMCRMEREVVRAAQSHCQFDQWWFSKWW